MAATIEDVARLARVSSSTVSRVINDALNVRETTRQSVRRAIAELNFEPDGAARTLRIRRTYTIGLILPHVAEPFYAELAEAIDSQARQHGYHTALFNVACDLAVEGRCLASLRRRYVDGAIFATPEDDTPYLTELIERGLPVVALDRGSHEGMVPTIFSDNYGALYQAISHLIRLGRRRIAYMTGYYRDRQTLRDRLAGYKTALADAHIPYRPELVWEAEALGKTTLPWGYEVVRRHLARGVAFDALFPLGDTAAIGALKALREAGRRVPHDVAVVALNDLPAAAFADPPLTTVAQSIGEMARQGVAMLMALIRGEPLTEYHVVLPTELRIRDSCGFTVTRQD